MQKSAIVGHGSLATLEGLKSRLQAFEKVVAVDGGLHYLHEMGVVPDLILGDMDSVDPSLLRQYSKVPFKKYDRDKDKSDTEIAVELLLEQGFTKVHLFSSFGKRVDHSLYNIQLLRRYPKKLVLENQTDHSFVLREGRVRLTCAPGDVFSLIPLSDQVFEVLTVGMRWELDYQTLSAQCMSLSNEAIGDDVQIEVGQGDLLITKSRRP